MGPTLADYDIGQIVGKGGFATVYRARDRSNKNEVAIKVIEKEKMNKANISYRVPLEINIHKSLSHSSIVRLYNYFEDDKFIYIVLEFCCNGNLYKQLKSNGPFSEISAADIVKQILEGLQFVHERGIVHRDLKLSNILLDNDMKIKICDFGLAVKLMHPDEEHYTLCGTPNYIAPEVVSHKAHGFPADLWSVGCLFFSIITGSPPFEDEGTKVNLDRLLCGEYIEPLGLSAEAIDFMKCLLHPDPSRRSSAKDILSHPFFKVNQIPTPSNEPNFRPNMINEWNDENVEISKGRNRHLYLTKVSANEKFISKSLSTLASSNSSSITSSVHSLSASMEQLQHRPSRQQDHSIIHQRQPYHYHHHHHTPSTTTSSIEYLPQSSFSSIGSHSIQSPPHQIENQQESSTLMRNQRQNIGYQEDVKKYNLSSLSLPLPSLPSPSFQWISTIHNQERQNQNQNQNHYNIDKYSSSTNSLGSIGSSSGSDHGMNNCQHEEWNKSNDNYSVNHNCRNNRSHNSSNHNSENNHRWRNINNMKQQQGSHSNSTNTSAAKTTNISISGGGLWSDAARELPPLKYISVKGEVLLVSEQGDVLYCTKLQVKATKSVMCRLCVRASNPLQLLLGTIDSVLLKELEALGGDYPQEQYYEDELNDEQYIYHNKENRDNSNYNNIGNNNSNNNSNNPNSIGKEFNEEYNNVNHNSKSSSFRRPSSRSGYNHHHQERSNQSNQPSKHLTANIHTNYNMSEKSIENYLSTDFRLTSSFTVYPQKRVDSTTASSSTSTIGHMKIFSDHGWMRVYPMSALPTSLQLIYHKVLKMLEVVKARIPKLILYLTPHQLLPLPSPRNTLLPTPSSSSSSLSYSQSLSPSSSTHQRYSSQHPRHNPNHHPTSSSSSRRNSITGSKKNIPRTKPTTANNNITSMDEDHSFRLSLSPRHMQCKCMLMRNTPLPDFCVQWIDGSKLRYALNSSRLTFTKKKKRGIVTTPASSSTSTFLDRRKEGCGGRQSMEGGSVFSTTTRTTAETCSTTTTTTPIDTDNTPPSPPTTTIPTTFHWENTATLDWTEAAPASIRDYLLIAQLAMKRCFLEEKKKMMSTMKDTNTYLDFNNNNNTSTTRYPGQSNTTGNTNNNNKDPTVIIDELEF